jgi:glycosyltransferase involved in cell wall biosynthesis
MRNILMLGKGNLSNEDFVQNFYQSYLLKNVDDNFFTLNIDHTPTVEQIKTQSFEHYSYEDKGMKQVIYLLLNKDDKNLIRSLTTVIHKQKFDFAICFDPLWEPYLEYLGIPYIYWAFSLEGDTVLTKSGRVIVQNPYYENQLAVKTGGKLVNVGFYFDAERWFKFDNEIKGWEGDENYILAIGDMNGESNIKATILDLLNSDQKIVVVGDGSEYEFISRKRDSFKDKVKFYTDLSLDEKQHIVNGAKYVIFNNKSDGSALWLQRCMSSGKVCIVNNLPEYKTLIKDGKNCIIAEENYAQIIDEITDQQYNDIVKNAVKVKPNKEFDNYIAEALIL